MTTRVVLFVNGEIKDYPAAARWLQPDDLLICADGGTRHCLALGRQPHLIVGDLDSLEPALVEQLAAQGVAIERHPAAKSKTDLELALDAANRRGAGEILLLGALGGRLDQMLANLMLLARRDWPARLLIAEGEELAQVLRDDEELTLWAPLGSTVSTLALSDMVTGITYTGLQYPLNDFTLRQGSTRGVSNVVVAAPATIRIKEGILLVIQQIAMEETG